MSDLEAQFDQAMMEIYYRAKSECNYVPSIFFNMLNQYRGVVTAKRLINATNVSDGYTKLYDLKRLDLTVEAVVFENTKWHELFSTEEIEKCRKRLADYRYKFKA
ncbi:MAG: hypothetical protein COA85_08385 [Robiginitomaculum sp.]|nr:MAG: hypothetical protein COA85_08385 [Robiginitomaculum sp.]